MNLEQSKNPRSPSKLRKELRVLSGLGHLYSFPAWCHQQPGRQLPRSVWNAGDQRQAGLVLGFPAGVLSAYITDLPLLTGSASRPELVGFQLRIPPLS